MRRGAALLAAAFAAASFHSPGLGAERAPIRLTLEKSIAIAVESATQVQKARNQEQLDAARLLESYARFLPNLALSGNYAYNSGKTLYTLSGVSVVDSRNLEASYQLTSALNLFNGLSDYASFKSALRRRGASELSLEFARQQIAMDVTQSFLQNILDQQIIEIARENLAASQARLRLLQGQTEVGAASPADLFRQQAQASSDEVFLTNARTKMHDDRLLLVQKLRLDPTEDYELEPPPLEPPPLEPPSGEAPRHGPEPGEDELIREALSSRKDFQALESRVESGRWDITSARAGYYPRLDLNLGRFAEGRYLESQTVNGIDFLPPSQQSLGSQLGNIVSYAVSISLTWNIFDRFLTRTAVEQARVSYENLQLDYEDLRVGVISQVRQARQDLETARQQVESSRVGLEAARKAYAVIQGRYRVGASSFIDLLASQSALTQAEASEAQARINLRLQRSFLDFYLGRLRPPGTDDL